MVRARLLIVSQRPPSQERQSAPPDLVVIQPVKGFTCAECGTESGDLFVMEDKGPLMSGVSRD